MHIRLRPRSFAGLFGMPPKLRSKEAREEGLEDIDAYTSPLSVASDASSDSAAGSASLSATLCGSLTAEQLDQILANNQKAMLEASHHTMSALLATFSSSGSSASVPKTPTITVPKWTDEEVPSEYFSKLEKALEHNGVAKSQWGKLLPVYLSGKAQAAFSQVDPTSVADYDSVKDTLLESLGDTPSSADRKWWSLSRLPGEDAGSFYLRIRAIGIRRLHGLVTREEILEKVILSRFLSLLPSDSYSSVMSSKPKNGLEAARLLREHEETRSYSGRARPWKQHNSSQYRRDHNGGSSHGSGSTHGSGSSNSGNNSSNASGGSPTKEQGGGQNSSASGSASSTAGKNGKSDSQNKKPIVCHGCGEPGHIRPRCPHKIRMVKSAADSVNRKEVDGWIADVAVAGLRIDTGADHTIVHAKFVPQSAYLNTSVLLDSWRGKQFSKHRLAKVKIKVGTTVVDAVVAVADELDGPALLGNDLGLQMEFQLSGMVFERVKQALCDSECDSDVVTMHPVETIDSECDSNVVTMHPVLTSDSVVNNEVTMQHIDSVRATRAQIAKENEERLQDDIASASSEAEPVSLADVFEFQDSFFEQEPVPTPVEECPSLPEECVVDIPLPTLVESDSDALVSEQKADETLKLCRQLAEQNEKGYSFHNDILVHSTSDGLGGCFMRVLVPKSRRLGVLEMAHSGTLSGHFGVKKTFARISHKFLWPKMWPDVKAYIRTCVGCQKASRKDVGKAPLQPLPCVEEPFAKVAFDLVGPLPISSSGYRYILTMMCLYTKFPAAIPLKRVDNQSVLEAMMEIFASYGIPRVLLTDQGSVFTSKLTKTMCDQFGIKKVQTSPYHPQTDGALERWHACLKGMMKRSQCQLKKWDKELKYLLFAYRSTPHVVTGYAPFTLMYGRDVRGPLEILQEAWLDGDTEPALVSDWLAVVKAKLGTMSEVVSEKERISKAKMKSYYDKSAKVRHFDPGEMVLVWKPGIHSKFGASWDGPYQVESKVSPVTYKIQVPGSAHKPKILHSNLLKKWCTSGAKVHRVVSIPEEESVCEEPVGLKLASDGFVPTEEEKARLESVLVQYGEVLSKRPGRTDAAELVIRTGSHAPVRSPFYRIPPRWREQVKSQIDQLLEWGIIRPSTSPWASSIVCADKKDGSVRICVDFRAVNAVTDPDPYQLPLIDEILEMLATAKFISKVDLTKGFHQIPISPSDCSKTAFCTPWGKFEYCFMPFGLRNGPAVFQRLMDNLLHQDKDISQVYIDDIVIFSTTWEEHCSHISTVLSRLKQAGLTANAKKCQWGLTKVEFLGHIVGQGKVSPAELKVKSVSDFKFPETKKAVRQFLGLVGYYRRFIPNFADKSFNLTEATRKTAPDRVAISDVICNEFSFLKQVLCSIPALTLPVPEDEFLLQTDASGVGLGAVLSVVRNGAELPVAFWSKKLLPRERNYSASELEGLAVVAAVHHFHPYLITHPFTLETDHRALVFLDSAQYRNGRLARWALKLQPYAFTIRYRKGSLNANADALSRLFEEDVAVASTPELLSSNGGGGDVMKSLPSRLDSLTLNY